MYIYINICRKGSTIISQQNEIVSLWDRVTPILYILLPQSIYHLSSNSANF